MQDSTPQSHGWYGNIIAWFANNSVAANLLMWSLIVGGAFTAITITKEVQPRIETNYVTVSVPYRGATPRDPPSSASTRPAQKGSGGAPATSLDVTEALDNIKNRVDAISTFPAETEQPSFRRNVWSQEVMWVSVFGDVSERTLKEVGRQIRDEIIALPNVTQANLVGDRPYEIGIEVREGNAARLRSDAAGSRRRGSAIVDGPAGRSD